MQHILSATPHKSGFLSFFLESGENTGRIKFQYPDSSTAAHQHFCEENQLDIF